MRAHHLVPLLAWAPLFGCVQAMETPSAYEDQRYLCATEHQEVWKQRVADCRLRFEHDADCGGVISFEGKLEGTPLKVESLLTDSSFLLVGGGGATPLLADVEGVGQSPYFRYTLKLRSLGGRADEVNEVERTYQVDPRARALPDALGDSLVEPSLRLSAGGDSVDLPGLADSGAVVVTYQAPDEIRGRFEADFGAKGDRVEGCFVVYPLQRSTVSE